MRTFRLPIILLLFSMNAIGQQNLPDQNFTGTLKDTNKNGMIITEIPYTNGKKNGLEKQYLENGEILSEIPYTNGKVNGVRKHYYYNGKLKDECPIIDDKVNGIEKQYFVSGNLRCETPYTNGVENGIEKIYYMDGKSILDETPFVGGRINGIKKCYYESGRVQYEIPYTDNSVNGVERMYLVSGKIAWEASYTNGKADPLPNTVKWLPKSILAYMKNNTTETVIFDSTYAEKHVDNNGEVSYMIRMSDNGEWYDIEFNTSGVMLSKKLEFRGKE